jgi:hypothetical protein
MQFYKIFDHPICYIIQKIPVGGLTDIVAAQIAETPE